MKHKQLLGILCWFVRLHTREQNVSVYCVTKHPGKNCYIITTLQPLTVDQWRAVSFAAVSAIYLLIKLGLLFITSNHLLTEL